MNIAAQLFTLRDYTGTPAGLEKTLNAVKEAGYGAVQVQIACCKGVSPVEFKQMADRAGLEICASHIPFRRLKEDLENVIKEHQLFGCTFIGIEEMPEEYRESEESYIRFAQEASEFGSMLRAYGLELIYHNHHFEMHKFGDKTGLELLAENSAPEFFKFEPDTYWIQAGGGAPATWIRKLKNRLPVVHLKDMAVDSSGKQLFAEVGKGNLDWPDILAACEEAGVRWYVVEQDRCPGDPLESLKISLDFLTAGM